MDYRILTPDDAPAFHTIRLRGLRESPSAFASSYEEECDRPVQTVASRLADDGEGAVFGALDNAELIGIAGVRRESHLRLRHKAFIWGVYVAPEARRRGAGRRLMSIALDYAFDTLGVRQVNLGVNTANEPAIALYESMGFTTFGVEKDFMIVDGVGHDEVHMVCRGRPG